MKLLDKDNSFHGGPYRTPGTPGKPINATKKKIGIPVTWNVQIDWHYLVPGKISFVCSPQLAGSMIFLKLCCFNERQFKIWKQPLQGQLLDKESRVELLVECLAKEPTKFIAMLIGKGV